MKRLFDISLAFIVLLLMPTVVSAVSAQDLNKMLATLDESVPGLIQLLFGASYVAGVFFIFLAINKLKVYAQALSQMSSEKSITKPILLLMVGVGFIWLPALMDSFLYTLWNYGTDSVLAYPANTDIWVQLTNPLINLLRVFGLISIVRGWGMLAKLGSEGQHQGVTGKAIIHIVGGVFAWNIVGVWDVVTNSLGIA
ncbi:MAG: hypothetical protein K2X50_04070 [Gammaproteobacteria bacterium]|nr:hypothetical protein [Gammaproteobacteria bacterium]